MEVTKSVAFPNEKVSENGSRTKFQANLDDEKAKKKNVNITCKYDRKQMRIRLEIEEWMDDQLRELYQCQHTLQIEILISDSGGTLDFLFPNKYKEFFLKSLFDALQYADISDVVPKVVQSADDEDYPIEIDIDDVLDTEEENKRSMLKDILKDASQPVDVFITDLLKRIQSLRKRPSIPSRVSMEMDL